MCITGSWQTACVAGLMRLHTPAAAHGANGAHAGACRAGRMGGREQRHAHFSKVAVCAHLASAHSIHTAAQLHGRMVAPLVQHGCAWFPLLDTKRCCFAPGHHARVHITLVILLAASVGQCVIHQGVLWQHGAQRFAQSHMSWGEGVACA